MEKIIVYQKLYQIILWDGEMIFVSEKDKAKVIDDYKNRDLLSIQLGDRFINKKDIRQMRNYSVTDPIEHFVNTLPLEVRIMVKDRNSEKEKKTWARFKSIEEIQIFLQNKGINYG